MSQIKANTHIEVNPLTGDFDLISGNNFSYKSVPANKKLKIPENMQMALHGSFVVDGVLEIEGELVIET